MGAPSRSALTVLAASLGVSLAGCRSLERFDTDGASAYCGSLVRAPDFHEGFVATGSAPSLALALELDAETLTTRPGTLSSNDSDSGLCSANGEPLFDQAPLRAIPELFHDALSQADFGDGHQHDFFAWVDSTCQGTMLAVVSLLTSGGVELRLLKPAPDGASNAPPEERPGFALFSMEKREQGCGY